MLIQLITQYLTVNKRIVVPQLGSFIAKAPGEGIVFSELLKRDDGVLRGLLQAQGMNELEAAGEIDRFVFEVRHAAEHGEEFPLEGFGIMKTGPNGTILFEYASQEQTPEPVQETNTLHTEEQPAHTGHAAAEPDAATPKISPSAKLNPEPYVKGLRYGKPRKNTDSYSYTNGKRRRMDRFMLIAITAAVIAVGAIVFGYFQMSRAKKAESEQIQTPAPQNTSENTAEPTTQTDAQ